MSSSYIRRKAQILISSQLSLYFLQQTELTRGEEDAVSADAPGNDSSEATDSGQMESDKIDGPSKQKETYPPLIPQITMPEELVSLVTDYLKGLDSVQESEAEEIVLDIWDFAGQHLYYASHPFFFTLRAVYLLVHNLSKDLNSLAEPCVKQGVHDILLDNRSHETNLDTLQSWLVSIHSIRRTEEQLCERKTPTGEQTPSYERPPVILVGTHADKKSAEDIKKSEGLIARRVCGKAYGKHVIRPFFAVDNKQGVGVENLRSKVAEVLESEPYMNENLPLKWLKFEKTVKDTVEREKQYHMKIEQARQLARSKCFIRDEKQLETMLNFYHDLGVVIHHGNTVVLQFRWLISVFKSLITIRPFHDQVSHSIPWNQRFSRKRA